MGIKAYTVPGLGKPLWLPDDIRVEIKLITNSRFRSYVKSSAQVRTTWHDTGPAGGNADGEWTWANNGREGAGAGGYNAIIDDDQIIICAPFDEVIWHAGTPDGNRTSWGAEQCREGVDRTRSIRNAAAFHGALIAAKGWEVDTSLVQHHWHYGKNCPSYIRANELWSSAVKQTSDAALAARLAALGEAAAGAVYVKPDPIPALDAISKAEGVAPSYVDAAKTRWFWVGDRVQVVKPTGRYRWADKRSAKLGPDLKIGEEFDVDWVTDYEGAVWFYSPWGTRIFGEDVQRISDTKGEIAA